MSVHDARPADVYVDARGKLWRCVGIIGEPSAIFEEIERTGPTAYPDPIRMNGGISGLMWNGFERVYRPSLNEAREGEGASGSEVRATTNLPPALLKGEPE